MVWKTLNTGASGNNTKVVKSVHSLPFNSVEELDTKEQGGVASSTAAKPGHVQEIALNRVAKEGLSDVNLTWKWSVCNSRPQRRLV